MLFLNSVKLQLDDKKIPEEAKESPI